MTGKKLTILTSDHFTFRILSGLEASVFFQSASRFHKFPQTPSLGLPERCPHSTAAPRPHWHSAVAGSAVAGSPATPPAPAHDPQAANAGPKEWWWHRCWHRPPGPSPDGTESVEVLGKSMENRWLKLKPSIFNGFYHGF